MNYNFHINDFEGPLDLLLHLIKEKKMDIYDVNISEIIDEYIEFIKKLENKNIDIASEYLVMSAELIHLKSKKLINKEEIEEDDFTISSEDDLKQKLIEYKKYKDMSLNFQKLEEKRNEIYTKYPENLNNYKDDSSNDINHQDINDLIEAFINFQNRLKYIKPLNTRITRKELSIEKRINEVRNIIKKKKKVTFYELFDIINKDYLIVTFLSILEMSKNKEIKLNQKNEFEEIFIEAM